LDNAHELTWPDDVDVAGALLRMGGNASLLHRTIRAFMTDAACLGERVGALLQQDALDEVRRELHAFKGLSGTLGIAGLAALAARAEKIATQKDQSVELPERIAEIASSISKLLPVLEQVACRLAPPTNDTAVNDSDVEGVQTALIAPLQELLAALRNSDMQAMELHAALRQKVSDAVAPAMQILDAAMAEMEFEEAAQACEKLITQWSE
jgi:HPt (histidine-containing phosphotransfer) domain-containing protein